MKYSDTMTIKEQMAQLKRMRADACRINDAWRRNRRYEIIQNEIRKLKQLTRLQREEWKGGMGSSSPNPKMDLGLESFKPSAIRRLAKRIGSLFGVGGAN